MNLLRKRAVPTFHALALGTSLALSLFSLNAQAALVSEASAFGPDTLTLDTQTGLRWLDVTIATPYSYDQLRAQLGAAGAFAGYRLATPDEVLELWTNAGIDTQAVEFTPGNFQPIMALMDFVGITGLGTGNRDNVHFFDFTAGHIESGVGHGNWVSVATVAADPYTFLDGRPDIGVVPSDNENEQHGAWLVVSEPPSGLVPIDTSFGQDTATRDTSTGLVWLDLTLSTPYSYDEVRAQLSPGGVFEGYRLATADEVLGLWASASIGTVSNDFVVENFQPIVDLMTLVGVTGVGTGNRDNVHFFDFTAGHIESGPGGGGWVNMADLAADPYMFLDGRAAFSAVPSNNPNEQHGSWLVALNSVPDALAQLSAAVDELGPSRLERRLQARISAALAQWQANQPRRAVRSLRAFIRAVESRSPRPIPALVADNLVAQAEAAIDMIRAARTGGRAQSKL
jgi:hypothetical protein